MTARQDQRNRRRFAPAIALGLAAPLAAVPVGAATAASPTLSAGAAGASTTALAGAGTSAGPATSAPPSCPVSVSIGGGDSGLTLTPDHARVHHGACVLYTNDTASPVSVQIDEGSKNWNSGTIDPDGYVQYPADVTGTHDVSVQQTRVLLPASGAGTVRVLVAASGSPSPSPSPSASSGQGSASHPARSGSRSGHRRAAPRGATSGRRKHRRDRSASGRAQLPPLHIPPGATAAPLSITRRGVGNLPRVAGPQPGAPGLPWSSVSPTPLPTGSVAAADPRLAPVGSGGSAGADLALAVGGLLALGQLAALLRVLAAVDNRRRGVGPRP